RWAVLPYTTLVRSAVARQTRQRRQVAGCLHPPEDRLDAGHQLGNVERLGDVVVRPQRQTSDPILGEATGGEEDDRGVPGRRMSSDPVEDRKSTRLNSS